MLLALRRYKRTCACGHDGAERQPSGLSVALTFATALSPVHFITATYIMCRNFSKLVIMAVGGAFFGTVYLIKLVVSSVLSMTVVSVHKLHNDQDVRSLTSLL